ncbi:MAG: hypothetical protein IKO40_06090 [Kiritimatiellae bacterium]|nr:hypothetical protein [Kiritimatiellia bacterium]
MADTDQNTQAYLARIRRTIEESERMVEAVKLRMAETDRMLEKQGLTREQVLNFSFSPEQRELVNRELARNGMEPLEDDDEQEGAGCETRDVEDMRLETIGLSDVSSLSSQGPDGELAERQRKFGMMMKPFQI